MLHWAVKTRTHTHTVHSDSSDTREMWRMHQTALGALIFGQHVDRDILREERKKKPQYDMIEKYT